MSKKIIATLLALVLLAGLLAACTGTETPAGSTSPSQSPGGSSPSAANSPEASGAISEEKISLTCMWPDHGYNKLGSWNDYPVLQRLEEVTNIHVDYITYGYDNYFDNFNIGVATGEMPDFYMVTGSVAAWDGHGANGVVILLEDLIAQNAPFITQRFNEWPDSKKSVTSLDGHIYTLPYYNMIKNTGNGNNMYMNLTWQERSGLGAPKTTDDFLNMLRYYKENDMNNDGNINDEIPLLSNYDVNSMRATILAWFGVAYSDIFFLLTRGKDLSLELLIDTAGYRAYVEYVSVLFSEGLLDQNLYTRAQEERLALLAEDKIGFDIANPKQNWQEWTIIPPLTSAINDTPLSRGARRTGSGGGPAISSNNKYPAETVKWFDMFFRGWDEDLGGVCGLFPDYGIKGLTWDIVDASTKTINYTFLDEVPEGESSWLYYLGYLGPGGIQMGYFNAMELSNPDPYFNWVCDIYMNGGEAYAAYDRQIPSALRFTPEENDRLGIIRTDMQLYLDDQEARFITGEDALTDANWNNFVKTMYDMGAQELKDAFDKALAAYDKG